MAEKSQRDKDSESISEWMNGTGRIVLPLILVVIVIWFVVSAITA